MKAMDSRASKTLLVNVARLELNQRPVPVLVKLSIKSCLIIHDQSHFVTDLLLCLNSFMQAQRLKINANCSYIIYLHNATKLRQTVFYDTFNNITFYNKVLLVNILTMLTL